MLVLQPACKDADPDIPILKQAKPSTRSCNNVSALSIVIIAIAASGVLMMRFRKRWLAKIKTRDVDSNRVHS